MNSAFIYEAVRTPVGRHGGALATVRTDDLAAIPVREVVKRSGIDPASVEDVILGCANQCGEDNRNVARMALLLAGLPVEVPGMTINRLCGSGLQAVVSAAHAIAAGEGDLFLCGGVESMTRAPHVVLNRGKPWSAKPLETAQTALGWRFVNPKMPKEWTVSLGETAEIVAERYSISREEQERFALESQRRAAKAIEKGCFDDEIVPVEVEKKRGATERVERDEHPRLGISMDDLKRLRPVFRKDGTVTAGTSSGINDGAAAMIVASEGSAPGRPFARVLASAVAGVDPACMGLGPIPATRKVLERCSLTVADLDLVELNEAFAAQALACIRELDLDEEKVNISGGGIALGHPLGCTGAKLLVTLVHALRRTGGRYGLVTMCIGVGQGIAMVVENVEREGR